MKKIEKEEKLPEVTLYFPKDREILVLEAEDGRKNLYHKIAVDLTFISTKEEFKRGFSDIFLRPKEIDPSLPIETRKQRLVEKTIAEIFIDFAKMAIYKPHQGKKAWEREKASTIFRLDPMKKYYVWKVLDEVYAKIE